MGCKYQDLFIAEFNHYLQALNNCLWRLEVNHADPVLLAEVFRLVHSLKGMSATMGYRLLVSLTHQLESVLDKIRGSELPVNVQVINLLFTVLDCLQQMLENFDHLSLYEEQVGILIDKIRFFVEEEGELPGQKQFQGGQNVVACRRKSEDNRVEEERLWSMEERHDRIPSLQNSARKIRMVDLKQVFERFSRMIHDFCESHHKQVNFVIKGEERALDCTIVPKIGGPLVHILRNALDHGLESEEERCQAGKPKIGTIKIEVYDEGSHVVFKVSDDGRGLDHSLLRRKAVERGFLSGAEAEALSPDEVLQLIFKPGFSTAAKITDLSGRGVGLDAALSAITALHGTIEIKSKTGRGSTFLLRLPLKS